MTIADYYAGPQPDVREMLRPSSHNISALVPSMCDHGAPYLVVDPDDYLPHLITVGMLADGRRVVKPKTGRSFVRAKYTTASMLCVVDQGAVRPVDLTVPASNRPGDPCPRPLRAFVSEVYDGDLHGAMVDVA